MVRKNAARVGTLAFVMGAASVATAQEPVPPPPRAAVAAEEGPSDHDRFVGHVGVTYFDIANLPIATNNMGGQGTVAAPVVGVRYWLQRKLGLDLGLGFGWAAGSVSAKVNGMNVPGQDPSFPFGFALHGGLPLEFGGGQHYSFLLVPETTLGFATQTIKGMGGAPDTSLNGVLFNLGARVGGEIHFGFIGVPQLALQGSIGLFFTFQQTSGSQGSGAGENSLSQSTTTLSTTVGPNPWAIFTNNISATYYL
jgi:hypothetical protein